MQLSTIISIIASVAATTNAVALPKSTTPDAFPSFQLKLKSKEQTLDGHYVSPLRVVTDANGVYWAVGSKSAPSGGFQLQGDALKYTDNSRVLYGSAGLYDSPDNLPVLNLRDEDSSPEGYSHGYHIDNGALKFDGSSEWWVCRIQATRGEKSDVLTFWRYMPAIFPPYPEQKGCHAVEVIVS